MTVTDRDYQALKQAAARQVDELHARGWTLDDVAALRADWPTITGPTNRVMLATVALRAVLLRPRPTPAMARRWLQTVFTAPTGVLTINPRTLTIIAASDNDSAGGDPAAAMMRTPTVQAFVLVAQPMLDVLSVHHDAVLAVAAGLTADEVCALLADGPLDLTALTLLATLTA